jgi:hypothetical protein
MNYDDALNIFIQNRIISKGKKLEEEKFFFFIVLLNH